MFFKVILILSTRRLLLQLTQKKSFLVVFNPFLDQKMTVRVTTPVIKVMKKKIVHVEKISEWMLSGSID